ncbi:type VI secretion system baseplate subunit TssG [Vibrio fluminensis]|uniref:type VI secretion system baseplate subunit TssG n=1 Tax=Vibrio fluminensis TaxID=2783614 RepID=UPI001E55E8C6|nr:type VI secretion system baseplate subunit TssG [Vibrio fluminensis]
MYMIDETVQNRLVNQPNAFDFVQVIRLLQAMNIVNGKRISLTPEIMPEGSPADVTSVRLEDDRVRIKLGLEALVGAKGVIPDYLYAELLNSLHQDDNALQKFIDVFNHRYFELRAFVETNRSLMLKQERDENTNQALGRLSQQAAIACMFALPGANRDKIEPSMLRHGLALGNKSRSLNGLKRLLSDYFSLVVTPVVSAASFYRINSQYQSKLGEFKGQNQRLGQGFWLGSTGVQRFKALEINITPQTRSEYLGLLNNPHFAQSMKSLVQAYLRESLDIKLYMYVKRDFIDEPKISNSKSGLRLGEANCLAPKKRKSEFRKILIQQEKV